MIAHVLRPTLHLVLGRSTRDVPRRCRRPQLAAGLGSFERLEPRELLSCEGVATAEGTLLLTGDEQDNRIRVVVDADGARVRCDGEAHVFPGVTDLEIQTFAGNDGVILAFQAFAELDAHGHAIVDTGAGHDRLWLLPEMEDDVIVDVDVMMGDGNDAVQIDGHATGDTQFNASVNLGPGIDVWEHAYAMDATEGQANYSHAIVDIDRGIAAVLEAQVQKGTMAVRGEVSSFQDGDDLFLRVVAAAENSSVDLAYEGSDAADNVNIQLSDVTDTTLQIDTHGGNDRLAYTLGDTATHEASHWLTSLATGPGDDTVKIDTSIVCVTYPCFDTATYDLDMGPGNDTVALAGKIPGDLDLTVLPGSGDNEVLIDLALGDPAQPVVLGAVWNSQDPPPGEDTSTVSFTSIFNHHDGSLFSLRTDGGSGTDDVKVDLHTPGWLREVEFHIDLGGGDDRAKFRWRMDRSSPRPPEPAALDALFQIAGGEGHDDILADLHLAPAIGSLVALVEGGEDDDRLGLRRHGDGGPRLAEDLLIDGGPGRDKCKASNGVQTINCEQ